MIVPLFVALTLRTGGDGGWRPTHGGWKYVERGETRVRLANAWGEPRPVFLIDGVHVFRDVDDVSVCGYDGPR